MATVVVGCDENNGNDSSFQNAVVSTLEKAGHTVEKLEIQPNAFATYSYESRANGKIGVYLIAAGITSIADLYDGNTQFKYGYIGIRGDVTSSMSSIDDFNNKPISTDWHGDCTSASCPKFAGKTFPQMNEVIKSKCKVVFGKTGEEMGNTLVKEIGGESTDSSEKKDTSGSSIKDALKKAVSKWDGDVEVKIVDDTVYVNKIPDPGDTKLVIDEYNHAYYDSITVTDINQDTINQLITNFGDYELTIKDYTLIKRFGLKPQRIELENTVKTLNDAKKALQREWNKIRRDDGRSIELKLTGNPNIKVGRWVRVYLPSYFIDDYMYISKASHDEDASEWSTSITLVDYPPSFGAYVEETKETETEDADTDIDSTDTDVTADTEGE